MKFYKVVVEKQCEKQWNYLQDISDATRKFEREVEEYLNLGWILQGGASVTLDNDKNIIFSQTLYLEG